MGGVGTQAEKCYHNCKLPIVLGTEDGTTIEGTFEPPTVPNSMLLGLLGLASCRDSRFIIDPFNNVTYQVGPGYYNIMNALPPGSHIFLAL